MNYCHILNENDKCFENSTKEEIYEIIKNEIIKIFPNIGESVLINTEKNFAFELISFKNGLDILKGNYIAPHVSIWYYTLDDISEVGDPSMWIKANPNLGKTVTYETYQLDVERAENAPSTRNDILAKRFNIPMEGYTSSLMMRQNLIESRNIGLYLVRLERIFHREMTSVHSRSCSL